MKLKNDKSVYGLKQYMLILMYIIVFIPYVFCIYNSMPANDDFALSLNWWGKGIVGEAIERVVWNYNNWFGQSGIIAILIQVLCNPLHWFNNSGHSFGICMLIANTIVMVFIIKSIRDILNSLLECKYSVICDIATFLIILIISSGNYYCDVYNWWSGFVGYAMMMLFSVLSIKNTVKYNVYGKNNNYILQIFWGICACTSLMCCVPVGVFYLIFTILFFRKNKDRLIKRILPFVMYVAAGVLTVAAPGNYGRKDYDESNTIISAIKVSLYIIVRRMKNTFIDKRWMLFLFIALVLCGMFCRSKFGKEMISIIIGIFGVIVSALGTILPYVYGNGKSIYEEFAPRAYYMLDYVLFIGMGIIAVYIGVFISYIIGEKNRYVFGGFASIAVLLLVYSILTGEIKQCAQIDIVNKSEIITESYDVWNGIFREIDQAAPDSDLIIRRPQLTWCQYVYYPGIDEEVCLPIQPGEKYANCNQSAAKHFGVNSVSVIFE